MITSTIFIIMENGIPIKAYSNYNSAYGFCYRRDIPTTDIVTLFLQGNKK